MTLESAASAVKKALSVIGELEQRVASLQLEKSEPIAVVGIGCRFPGGASTPEQFWELLASGTSALTEVPASRWEGGKLYDGDPDAPGKIYVRGGYFIDHVDSFDASFFGISPREAEQMDPQQRLLLEVCWEALERAAQPWQRLRESRTGVFVGIATYDYAQMLFRSMDYRDVDSFSGTGNAYSFHSGRISYLLGLQGPCLSIDTACSSSLVAIHLACASLRSRESDCALAGGVQLLLSPIPELFLCRSHALSADGTCKAFAAGADGYGRGEGCGVVVLKRLSDALAHGDTIWAVIRTSAVNHDGPSSGLTVPNPRAQVRLLETALKQAELGPETLDYVEAHGVGTPIGDPIEMRSIAAALGAGRHPERPLYVGSAKTNIGHLEGAAGIAGFIKTVLSVKYGEIPPNLNFDRPSPDFDWSNAPVAIPTRLLPWPHERLPRRAGVNAFGLSGTNAHVIVENAPAARTAAEASQEASQTAPGYQLLAFSAKSGAALADMRERHRAALESVPDAALAGYCFTASACRAHFNHRLAVVASDAQDLRAGLEPARDGRERHGVHVGRLNPGENPRAAFLFTGQGAQYAGMGRRLYERYAAFRGVLDQCDELLRHPEGLGVSIRDILFSPGDPRLGSALHAQLALFSFEMALTELWRSFGVTPDLVVGHSLGEYAAACAAGVFELEDGLRLLVARGKLVESLASAGAMATAFASEETLTPHLAGFAGEVDLAAINGPELVVLSGAKSALSELLKRLRNAELRVLELPIAQAFHSPLVEPVLDQFRAAAARVRFARPHTTLISNFDGQPAGDAITSPDYWCRHLRGAVRFYDCLRWLHRDKLEVFVEIGPEPILLAFDQSLPEGVGANEETRVSWLPSIRRGLDEDRQLLESLGALYTRGFEIDWEGVNQGAGARRADVPTYAFERKRYWAVREAAAAPAPPSEPQGVGALLESGHVDALLAVVDRHGALDEMTKPAVVAALRALSEYQRAATAESRFEGAVYRTVWEAAGVPSVRTEARFEKPWILFGEPEGLVLEFAGLVRARGGSVVFVADGPEYTRQDEQRVLVAFDEPAQFRRLLNEITTTAGGRGLGGVLFTWLDRGSPQRLSELESIGLRRAGGLLHLLQAVGPDPSAQDAIVWAVTRGALMTGDEPAASLQPFAAMLWGAAKVAALEYPRLWGGIIDSLDPASEVEEAARVAREIAARSAEDQVAFRGGERRVPRLVPARLGGDVFRFSAEGRYVITGGLGFLGLHIAEFAIDLGARQLVLVSRREPDASTRTRLAALEARGAQIEHVRADVTDQAAMQALFGSDGAAPIRGVFHLAGIAGFVETSRLSYETFLDVLHPKITGTRILHAVSAELDLDFFFCSSSLSSVWGYKGGFHYAAANAFLDSFMQYRRANGAAGLAVNIGPCAGGGVAEPQFLELLEKVGVVPITPAFVTAALKRLLGGAEGVMVARMNWPVFKDLYEAQRPSPFLSKISSDAPPNVIPASTGEPRAALIQKLRDGTDADRRDLVLRALQREVADVLRLQPPDEPDPKLGFFSMGMDSVMVMELRGRIQRTFEISVPATVVFNKPSIEALSEHLLALVHGAPVQARSEPTGATPRAVSVAPEALDGLSEDELERMLDETLQAVPGERT